MKSYSRRRFLGLEVASLDCGGTHVFIPHFHDEFVIGVNVRGSERIKLDRKDLEAHADEITLYNPAQVQAPIRSANTGRF